METNDDLNYRKFTGKAENDKAINSLKGILHGINIDNEINLKELNELDLWAKKHYDLVKRNPFREFIITIRDGIRLNIPKKEAVEDLYWLCQKYEEGNIYYDAVTADLQTLQGICHGILSDGIIKDGEITELQNWIDKNAHLSSYYPYDELKTVLQKILEDGFIDKEEKVLLKAYFKQFVQLNDEQLTSKINQETINTPISGLCTFDPHISIDGNQFCVTGKLKRSKRADLAEKIEDSGGIFNNGLNLKTNYLIVGDNGNPAWAFACYGRKVEKALDLRKKGKNITIVHELDFWDYLDDVLS